MDARILFVDDKPERLSWFTEQLENLARTTSGLGLSSADVAYAQTGPEALELLKDEEQQILVAVVDIDFSALPPDRPLIGPDAQREGLDIAREIRRAAPDVPVFLFTMTDSDVTTSDPGVHVVPFDSVIRRDVVNVLLEFLAELRAREQGDARDDDLPPSFLSDPGINYLRRLARSSYPLLLLGETGTGKTVLARWIHRASGLKRNMERVDCAKWKAGGDPNIMKAALFGSVRGAYTGAVSTRRGSCEAASGSTLFLDEIGDLPGELQASLLTAVEEQVIRRVGENTDREVSFRLISATNRPVQELRSDFFHRISTGDPIVLRPLRERPEDICWLAEREVARINGKQDAKELARYYLAEETLQVLETYEWLGNGRELRGAIENATTQLDGGVILPQHLPPSVMERKRVRTPIGMPRHSEPTTITVQVGVPLDSVSRKYLLACWRFCGFSRPKAAELAQVARTTFWRDLLRAGVYFLASIKLDGLSLEEAAAEMEIPLDVAKRLSLDTESHLLKEHQKNVEWSPKAKELRIDPARLTALVNKIVDEK